MTLQSAPPFNVSATNEHEASFALDAKTKIIFATAEQGRALITNRDDYIEGLSKFDRSAKLRVNEAATEEEFLAFFSENVLEWSEDEKQMMVAALEVFRQRAAEFNLNFPDEVYFVKTTGNEEGGAAYTRGNAVFYPQVAMTINSDRMNWLVCHELFHVLTRANPELREALYEIIGFEKCNDIALPDVLRDRKISNPDAPWNDYFMRIGVEGVAHKAIPIIISREEKYDVEKEPSFFRYLGFYLMLVEGDEAGGEIRPLLDEAGEPSLFNPDDVEGFFEQIGRNTTYIIHPEEVLAENFVYTLFRGEDLKPPYQSEEMDSPHILDAIDTTLKAYGAAPRQNVELLVKPK